MTLVPDPKRGAPGGAAVVAWCILGAFLLLVIAVLMGCARPNAGLCPPEYSGSYMRNEGRGKVVLWCQR